MPKYIIGGSYGHVGTDWKDEVEAETLEDAENEARDYMMERIEWWATDAPADGEE